MINKNFYRKTNDKKILHKVGKQWKVVSVALLMAIGGAAVATHANANADANTNAVDNTVTQLNSSAVANPPRYAAPSSVVSSSANKSVASSAIHYYTDANNGFSGYNGIAASYFDQVSDENKVVQKNYNTVNSYVQSLNAEYNPQMHSYGVKINSASDAAKNDSKLAKSYSATTRNNATFATINSLAAKSNLDPTAYQGAVENNERYYSNAVSSASADTKAASDVNSLVNKLEGTNLSNASLQASVAAGVANSNYSGAQAVLNSLKARYHEGNVTDNTSLATRLAADAEVLSAAGNEIGNDADYQALMSATPAIATQNSLTSDINKAVSTAVTSVSNRVSADLNSFSAKSGDLDTIASSANSNDYFLSGLNDENGKSLSGTVAGVDPQYKGAVSAATNYSLAGVLSNAADDLLGHGNAAYNTAYANSVAGSRAISSASAKARYASYIADYTHANSSIVSSVSNAVAGSGSNDLASYAASALNDGLDQFGASLGIESLSTSTSYNVISSGSVGTYFAKLGSVLSGSASDASLASNVFNNGGYSAGSQTPSQIAVSLTNVENSLNTLAGELKSANNTASTISGTVNGVSLSSIIDGTGSAGKRSLKSNNSLTSLIASATSSDKAISNAVNTADNDGGMSTEVTSNSASLSILITALNKVAGNLASAATDATKVSANAQNGFSSETINNGYVPATGESADAKRAALLSDGIDFDQLESEAGAISDVNNTARTALQSNATTTNFNSNGSAVNLANALSVAASSANSALGSANTASANYSAANDEDVTLASYFASSYTNEANSESASAVDLNDDLSSYLVSMTGDDSTFASADSNFNSANYAAANDYKLGVGYAQAIYNSHAHFLDVLKNAKLHSTPDFGSKNYNDKVVGSVNKGDRLTVLGVNVSRNNDWRGVVRYAVVDNSNGKKGFITGQPAYTKAAYLSAITAHSDVDVKTLKPVNVYAQENGKKVLKTISAGQVLHNADVVYDSAEEDAYGFTKVQLSDGNFITANTDYVEIVNPTVTTPTNNTPSEFGFNLNGGQNMAPYYNNLTQN